MTSKLVQKVKQIFDDLTEGTVIQESSTKLMQYVVQDFLDYSQIKAGKFRKNIKAFNVRETVR